MIRVRWLIRGGDLVFFAFFVRLSCFSTGITGPGQLYIRHTYTHDAVSIFIFFLL